MSIPRPFADQLLMASDGTGILGARLDDRAVHRRVVLAGAVAAWLVAAVFLVVGFGIGGDTLFLQAAGPMLAAGVMTIQVLLHREDARVALAVSAATVVGAHAMFGLEATDLAAALALVVICSAYMLFVERNRVSVGITVAVVLVLVPQLWIGSLVTALSLGLVMGFGFALTAMILVTIQEATTPS